MEQSKKEGSISIKRVFGVSQNAVSFYSEHAQIMNTGNEVMIQFYEMIPSPPPITGAIAEASTNLRATITVSFNHARQIGELLLKHIDIRSEVSSPSEAKESQK